MLGRIWGFVKRHKKKVIFTSILAGGAYGAYRYVYPKIRQLRELVEAVNALEKLAGGGAEGAAHDEDSKEEKQARLRDRQEVYDKYACKGLGVLQVNHESCFFIKECISRVKEAQSSEAKLECLHRYAVECLAFCISALYALHVLLLLQRMQFNIVGREMDAAGAPAATASQTDANAYEAFLESTSYLKEEGVRRIADSARRAVGACTARASITPQTPVTAEDLQRLAQDTCLEVDAELLAGSHAAASLLPESIDGALATEHAEKTKRLLDEARDYLESPQFLEVFRAVAVGAMRRLSDLVGDGAPDPGMALIAGGQSKPLAKLLGQLIEISKASLMEESAGGFVELFAKEPLVDSLCERVYFQTTC